jgi:hypothetical protein
MVLLFLSLSPNRRIIRDALQPERQQKKKRRHYDSLRATGNISYRPAVRFVEHVGVSLSPTAYMYPCTVPWVTRYPT